MKKIKVATILCVFMASIIFIGAETNQDKEDSKQIAELVQKVELLEGRIKALEEKLQLLTSQTRVFIPESFPKIQKIPEDWSEFEFNGMKYYSIPLKTQNRKTKDDKK